MKEYYSGSHGRLATPVTASWNLTKIEKWIVPSPQQSRARAYARSTHTLGLTFLLLVLNEYRESTQVLMFHHIGSGGCEWSSYNKVLPPVDGKDAKTHCFPFPPSLE